MIWIGFIGIKMATRATWRGLNKVSNRSCQRDPQFGKQILLVEGMVYARNQDLCALRASASGRQRAPEKTAAPHYAMGWKISKATDPCAVPDGASISTSRRAALALFLCLRLATNAFGASATSSDAGIPSTS
jgi:hypothetical protein